MTTETLFTLQMAPAYSADHARGLAAQGVATAGTLELRVLPVDADGRVTAVASPAEATRVLIDLRVVPGAETEPEDAAGYRLGPPTPGPSSKVWQICPGVALRVTLPAVADVPAVNDLDVQGFAWMEWPLVAGGIFAGYGVRTVAADTRGADTPTHTPPHQTDA